MIIDPKFTPDNPNRLGSTIPTSVKKKLWDQVYLTYFNYDGQHYYIDKRQPSPFNYEYDLWEDNGEGKLQRRVSEDELADRLIKYIKRKRKLNKILGIKE